MASSSSFDVNHVSILLDFIARDAVSWADGIVARINANHRNLDFTGVFMAWKKVVEVADIVEAKIDLPDLIVYFFVVLEAQQEVYHNQLY